METEKTTQVEESEFQKSLKELVKSVENKTIIDTVNYLSKYVDQRVDILEAERSKDEYNYCEQLGRIKELQDLLKMLKHLKTLK